MIINKKDEYFYELSDYDCVVKFLINIIKKKRIMFIKFFLKECEAECSALGTTSSDIAPYADYIQLYEPKKDYTVKVKKPK